VEILKGGDSMKVFGLWVDTSGKGYPGNISIWAVIRADDLESAFKRATTLFETEEFREIFADSSVSFIFNDEEVEDVIPSSHPVKTCYNRVSQGGRLIIKGRLDHWIYSVEELPVIQ